MPGVLIMEALAQTGAVAILSLPEHRGKTAYFAGIDKAKFKQMVHPGDTLELETTKACRLSGKNEALKKQLLRQGVEPEEPHPISDVIMPHYMDMDETMAMIGWKHYAGLPAMSVQAFLDRLLEEEKIYMGSHDFYAYLRREGYICKVDGNNVITEKAEYMRILENGGGKTPGGRGIRVTASGCDYFKDRLEELHEKMRRARPAGETQD